MTEQMGYPERIEELEHIPTAEEVHNIFRLLIKDGRTYSVTKEKNDAQGLYELEIKTTGEKPGETIEYEYRRFKSPEVPEIHVVYYENDMPDSGTSAASFINDEWVVL